LGAEPYNQPHREVNAVALTHAGIVSQVVEDTGRSDKADEIGNYVNRSQNIIVRDASLMNHDFTCLKKEKTASTADGTKTYKFPLNMKSLYDLRICESGSSGKLHTLTARAQDAARPYPEGGAEGFPTKYIPWGIYFELSPIPDNTYTMHIRYLRWPVVMTTGAESELLYMDEVIIKCADWLTVLSLNIEPDIRRFQSEYRSMLRAAVTSDRQAHKYDTKVKAQPFVGGRTSLEREHWLKPSLP